MSSVSKATNSNSTSKELAVLAKQCVYLYASRYYEATDNEIDTIVKNLDYSIFNDRNTLEYIFEGMIKFGNNSIFIKLIKKLLEKGIEITGGMMCKIFLELIARYDRGLKFNEELFCFLVENKLVSKIRYNLHTFNEIKRSYYLKDNYMHHQIENIIHFALQD
jgi:hypothetical protein